MTSDAAVLDSRWRNCSDAWKKGVGLSRWKVTLEFHLSCYPLQISSHSKCQTAPCVSPTPLHTFLASALPQCNLFIPFPSSLLFFSVSCCKEPGKLPLPRASVRSIPHSSSATFCMPLSHLKSLTQPFRNKPVPIQCHPRYSEARAIQNNCWELR